MEQELPGSTPHVIPSTESMIPSQESQPSSELSEVMKRHIEELSKRNEFVDSKLLADVGVEDSRALIFADPLESGDSSYRMVVTKDGIMAIQVTNEPGKNKGKNQLEENIRYSIDDSKQLYNRYEGYDGNIGSNNPVLRIPGAGPFTIIIGRSGSRSDLEDYSNVKLITNPPEELVNGMIQTGRKRFIELTTEKLANTQSKIKIAEGLKNI